MSTYPANLELHAPEQIARWRPLVHWLLAIPQLIIANVLSNVASVLAFISWFVILFTGKLPAGIANFQCMVLRYELRTYSYAIWLREPYPPFEFDTTASDPGTDPIRVHVEPRLVDRNRLTVGLRLIWIIPIALFALVIIIALYVVVLISFFAVIFTGRWPTGLRDFAVGAGRLWLRVNAYGRLLVDDYPPFSLDGGQPTSPSTSPSTSPAPGAPLPPPQVP